MLVRVVYSQVQRGCVRLKSGKESCLGVKVHSRA